MFEKPEDEQSNLFVHDDDEIPELESDDDSDDENDEMPVAAAVDGKKIYIDLTQSDDDEDDDKDANDDSDENDTADDGNKHPKLTAVGDDEDDDGNKHMYGDGDVENASEYYPSGSSQEEDDEDDNYADEDEDEAVFDEADEDLISNDAENERDVFDEVQLKLVARLQSAGLADHLASLVGGRRSISSIKTLCNRVAR